MLLDGWVSGVLEERLEFLGSVATPFDHSHPNQTWAAGFWKRLPIIDFLHGLEAGLPVCGPVQTGDGGVEFTVARSAQHRPVFQNISTSHQKQFFIT